MIFYLFILLMYINTCKKHNFLYRWMYVMQEKHGNKMWKWWGKCRYFKRGSKKTLFPKSLREKSLTCWLCVKHVERFCRSFHHFVKLAICGHLLLFKKYVRCTLRSVPEIITDLISCFSRYFVLFLSRFIIFCKLIHQMNCYGKTCKTFQLKNQTADFRQARNSWKSF